MPKQLTELPTERIGGMKQVKKCITCGKKPKGALSELWFGYEKNVCYDCYHIQVLIIAKLIDLYQPEVGNIFTWMNNEVVMREVMKHE